MDRSNSSTSRLDQERKREDQDMTTGQPAPHRDDQNLQEAVGRLEPGRRPETDEPVGSDPGGEEVLDRSDFARWFAPSAFPASAGDLARSARGDGAPDWVAGAVEDLDAARTFATIGELFEASGARRGGEADE